MSLDTSARLVKAAGPELVRPHLPLLVPAMLESLRYGVGDRGSGQTF